MINEGWREFSWPDPTRGPWLIRIEFGNVEGRVECIAFSVRQSPEVAPAAINSAVFRSFPFGAWLQEALKLHQKGLRRLTGLQTPGDLKTRAKKQLAVLEARRRSLGGHPVQYGHEHYALVAKTYLEAPSKPTQAVAQKFTLSTSAAAKHVARARQLGLLAPTTRGKRGGR